MRRASRRILTGVIGSLLVLAVTLQMNSASWVGGRYLPVGHDAFYHAARIRDAVISGHVEQFDARMHAPSGDWVTWPWAYDAAIATVVRVATGIGSWDPATVTVFVPVLLGIIAVWLVVGVTALLSLPVRWAALAVICFAISAYTQFQFGVGALDHHGAEQIGVLSTLSLGMLWLRRPDSPARALAAGVVLGLAPGVHAGLILLQVPLLAVLLVQWIAGQAVPFKSACALAAGLLIGVAAILVPSETFWQGRFELYYLSWLQAYATAVVAVLAIATSRWRFSRGSAFAIAVLGLALALPMIATLRFSAGFLSGDLPSIARIDEIRSPYAVATDPLGVRRVSQVYSLLIWVAPVLLIASLWRLTREPLADRRLFWTWSVLGIAFAMLQQRLGSLGVPFLSLSFIVILERWSSTRSVQHGLLIAVMALLVAYAPTLRWQLFGSKVAAMDEQFSTLRPIIPALTDICHRQPGVVLATPGDGHLVRYFTDCSVVANNFRLTPTDLGKVAESLRLIGEPAADLHRRAPYVNYVLARLIQPAEAPDPVLFSELLNPTDRLPPGFRRLATVGVDAPNGTRTDYLGIFAVDGAGPVTTGP